LSPARRERTTLSKIVSTITSLSLRVSSAKRETSSIRSAFVIVLLPSQVPFLERSRLPSAETPASSGNLHNLLKFQGLYASRSLGKPFGVRFWAWGTILSPCPGAQTCPLSPKPSATSTDSKNQRAAPAFSRCWAGTAKRRPASDRAAFYDLSPDAPALARPRCPPI